MIFNSDADAPIEVALPELVKAAIASHAVNPKLHKVLDEEVPRIGRLKQVTNAEEKINALLRAYLEQRRDRIVPQNLDLAVFILGRTVEALTHAERYRTSGVTGRWTDRARNYKSFVVLSSRNVTQTRCYC